MQRPVIPLETYKDWAARLLVIQARVFSAIIWTNLYRRTDARGIWVSQMDKAINGIKDRVEELSLVQHSDELKAIPNDEALFFYASNHNHADDFTAHWRARVHDVMAQHRGRGLPKPALSEEDRQILRAMLIEPTRQLVAEMRAAIRETREHHTDQALDRLTTMEHTLARVAAALGID
jgi:hypothetical protein